MADCKKYNGSTWQHSLRKLGTATDTLTTLPADVYADGNNATVGLKGNMSQTGTPTPSSPIQPSECGDLSENLYDASNPNVFKGYYDTTSNRLLTTPNNAFIYIPLVQGRKYYIYGCKRSNASTTIRWVTTSSVPYYNIPCIRTGQFAQTDIFTITAEANENYLAIFLCGDSDYNAYSSVEAAIAANGANLTIDNGYKIPISSGGVITNVYLSQPLRKIGNVADTVGSDGTVTRRIKKIELHGGYLNDVEAYNYAGTNGFNIRGILDTVYERAEGYCSMYPVYDGSSYFNCLWIGVNNPNVYVVGIGDVLGITDANDFLTWCETQYNNGTPFTIWYPSILTPTTEQTTAFSIPTITGKDTFDVLTTLKPSSVSLNYTGWHDATVEEWDGSDWQ